MLIIKVDWHISKRLLSKPVILTAMLVLLTAALVRADGPNRVGLVVVHGNGEVIKQCIEFSEDKISGYKVLERSGLDLAVDVSGGVGTAICGINGEGCDRNDGEECFCQCQGSPCVYWSYWTLDGSNWKYSGFGASNRQAKHGDVEGWVWGEGTNNSAAPPPKFSFEDICRPATNTPTPTPSPTVTHTPQPTATPWPTDTPKPTHTPKPEPTPIIHHFSADRTTVRAGESVTLSWNLDGATAAFLRYNGQQEPVVSPGSKTVSPSQTTVYTLLAQNSADSEAEVELTITIDASAAPATDTPQPAVQAAAAPASAPPADPSASLRAGTPTPSPAGVAQSASAPPAPAPDIDFNAAALLLPRGGCTSLSWTVAQAEVVYLDGVQVGPQGSQQVCPAEATNYTLRAVNGDLEQTAQIALQITEPVAAVSSEAAENLAEPLPPPVDASEAQSAPPTATPAVLASNDSGQAVEPLPRPRRFTVADTDAEEDAPARSLLLVGGATLALILFLVVPVLLVVAGWVVWWLRGHRR